MDLLAMLPWWAGVLLAPIAFWVLHGVATQPAVVSTIPGQMAPGLIATMWKAMAGVGQYLVPVMCLIAAGASALRRQQRRQLLANTANSTAADVLDGMTWQQFELLVGEAFRRQGYRVVETGGGGADGGIDLVLAKPAENGQEKVLVQCKQWRALKVGVDVVRELYGVMAARGATGGIVVTSGRFTDEAVQFAQGRNVRLIDGGKLRGMVGVVPAGRGGAGGKRGTAGQRNAESAVAAASAAPATGTVPGCPTCGKPMVLRAARRGANAGSGFWGCSGFPGCRGTRDVE